MGHHAHPKDFSATQLNTINSTGEQYGAKKIKTQLYNRENIFAGTENFIELPLKASGKSASTKLQRDIAHGNPKSYLIVAWSAPFGHASSMWVLAEMS
jgi:hypothetical protein